MRNAKVLACASLMVLAMAAQARAASTSVVYGGGSTLAAPIYRDAFNCFATAAHGIFYNTPGSYPAGMTITYPNEENPACSKQGTGLAVNLADPVGSDAATNAFTNADPAYLASPALTNTVAYLDSAIGVPATPYPQIQYAATDLPLTQIQVSEAEAATGRTIFQLPAFVFAIALPVGQTQAVQLTTSDVCSLFAGAANTAANVTFSELVVRADSDTTTYIFSWWLSFNCPSSLGFNAQNGFPSYSPNWKAVANANGNALPIVTAASAGAEASTVAGTRNALGYALPRDVYPVNPSSAYPAYLNGHFPSAANIRQHFQKIELPASYDAAGIGMQLDETILTTRQQIGYPLEAFTFIDAYSCYSNAVANGHIGNPGQGQALLNVLKYMLISGNKIFPAILTRSDFVPISTGIQALLTGTGGPFDKTYGIQNSSCPSK